MDKNSDYDFTSYYRTYWRYITYERYDWILWTGL